MARELTRRENEVEEKYRWRQGRHKVKADVAAAELDRIRRSYGQLSASLVLQEASNPSNPLHPDFEWDDSEAAHQFRLIKARNIIREVTVIRPNEDPKPMFVHVTIPEQDEGEYVPVRTLVHNTNQYKLVLLRAQNTLEAARADLLMLLSLRPAAENVQSAISSVEDAEQAIAIPT